MRIDFRYLRWTLLAFYIGLVLALVGMGYLGDLPDDYQEGLVLLDGLRGHFFVSLFIVVLTFTAQILFISSTVSGNLCLPLKRKRLLFPVLWAAALMTVLLWALLFALFEYFEVYPDTTGYIWVILLILVWIGWAVLFFSVYKNKPRLKVFEGLVTILLGSSLLHLLITIPIHLIVRRRPGCFSGLYTSLGVSTGIVVMLWAFGPGLIFLFFKEKYELERKKTAG